MNPFKNQRKKKHKTGKVLVYHSDDEVAYVQAYCAANGHNGRSTSRRFSPLDYATNEQMVQDAMNWLASMGVTNVACKEKRRA